MFWGMPRDRTAALEACHAALSQCHERLPRHPTLIAAKAEQWLYGHEFLQVQIDHGLQGFARGRLSCRLRQGFEPVGILGLKRNQGRDRVEPAPR